jgi:hypothetical protein
MKREGVSVAGTLECGVTAQARRSEEESKVNYQVHYSARRTKNGFV